MSILDDEQQKQAAAAVEGGLLPEGEHLCHITAVEPWKQGDSLLWKLAPDSGEREVWTWTPLKAAGIWRTKERFAALGVALDASEEAFVGMPVRITVEHGEYNGEPKVVVTDVQRVAGDFVSEAKRVVGAAEEDTDIPF